MTYESKCSKMTYMTYNQFHTTRGQFSAGFFTVAEAAAYLRVSDKSVRRLISRGLLRPSKALRKLLIPCEQLETFYERTQ